MTGYKRLAWDAGVIALAAIVVLLGPRLTNTKQVTDEDARLLKQITELQADGKLATIEQVDQRARIVSLEMWQERVGELRSQVGSGSGIRQTVEVHVGPDCVKDVQVNGEQVEGEPPIEPSNDDLTRHAAELLVGYLRNNRPTGKESAWHVVQNEPLETQRNSPEMQRLQ